MPKKSKHPVIRQSWPKIIDYRSTAQKCLMLDARPHGKREYFKSVGEAKARADQLAAERENRGTEAISFSTKDRVMAAECSEQLRPFGKTLRDATQHYTTWLKSEKAKHESLLVSECVDQFIASRQADVDRGELDKKSFYETRDRAKRMKEVLGNLHIGELDEDRVKTYLDSFPVAPRTRHNIRLRMSKFFSFCKSKGWITSNPCADIKIKVKRADTRILSVAEAKHLLSVAEKSEHALVAVPYAALCLFAGLRPGEAEQLEWSQVNFETKSIEVLSHTSKGRETRFVKMEPTLIRWLKPYSKLPGSRKNIRPAHSQPFHGDRSHERPNLVVRTGFRKKWELVKRAAGYDPSHKKSRWVQDIMRHSYASYWLAIYQNRAALAEQMGNSVEVIRAHYRRPILKAEAKRFWAIKPTR
jgi:integrase